jgi:hypothetical protein
MILPPSNICRFDFFIPILTIVLLKKLEIWKKLNIDLNYIM